MTDIQKILLGAAIAIFGGIVGKIVHIFIDEWRERKSIKTSLRDELGEISSIIGKFSETYDSTTQLIPAYLTQLKNNTDAYDSCRGRLYLMWKEKSRTDVNAFYKKLKKSVEENEGQLGSLSNTQQGKTTEQNVIIGNFKEIKTEADDLKTRLKKAFV